MTEQLPSNGNHSSNVGGTVKKALFPVFVILCLVTASLFMIQTAFERGSQREFSISEGQTVPDFTLHRLEGGETLFSALDKKLFIVNFWATWCESCILEMPSLVELRESFKDRGLEIVGINVDESPEMVVPPVLREMGIRFPIFVDKDGKLSDLFDVSAIPTTIVLDADRNVLFVETGERDWNSTKVRKQVEKWLNAG